MKKLILLLFFSSALYAQEDFNRFSIEPEIGFFKIQDFTSVLFGNVDLGARYMANEHFGGKVSLNYTKKGIIEYSSVSFMPVVNVGRVLKFETFTNDFTILAGIGGNLSNSNGTTNETAFARRTNFHLSAFSDLEYKLFKRVFLRAGIDMISGVNVNRSSGNIAETTNVFNFNIGATFNIGKHEEHADFYIRPIEAIKMLPTIIDRTVTNNITTPIKECNCNIQRYLYFANDSYKLTQDTREAIEYTKDKLLKSQSVTLKAYCSNVGNVEHNKRLAQNRAFAVKKALIGLGVEEEKIILEPIGIDYSRGEDVLEFGRRVELIVK